MTVVNSTTTVIHRVHLIKSLGLLALVYPKIKVPGNHIFAGKSRMLTKQSEFCPNKNIWPLKQDTVLFPVWTAILQSPFDGCKNPFKTYIMYWMYYKTPCSPLESRFYL